MIRVTDYKLQKSGPIPRIVVREQLVCPGCGAELVYRDYVKRMIRDEDGRSSMDAGASVSV